MELNQISKEMIDAAVTRFRATPHHVSPESFMQSDPLTILMRALVIGVLQQVSTGELGVRELQTIASAAFQYGFESAMALMEPPAEGLVH